MERVLKALLDQRQMFVAKIISGVPDYSEYREMTGIVKGLERAIGELEEAIRKEKQREVEE